MATIEQTEGVNILVCGYRHHIVGLHRIGYWLQPISRDENEEHVSAHFLFSICVCFRAINGGYMTPQCYNLLLRVLFRSKIEFFLV